MNSNELLGLLVRANLAASAAILVVLALRLVIAGRFGARVGYALWALVPVATLGVLIPARRITMVVTPAPATEPPPIEPVVTGRVIAEAFAPPADVADVALIAWTVGAVGCLVALALAQHAFRRGLGALRAEDGVFRAEVRGAGPVLLGLWRPRIVVPADFESTFSAPERDVILAHERAHRDARDHLVNAATALAQCLCWFNPLVHLAAFHLRTDQELACDQAVMERHPERRRTYAEAMVKAQLIPAVQAPLACHWPGRGAQPLKRRIARLQAKPTSRTMRRTGFAAVAGLGLAVAAAAWAAQPPSVDVVEGRPSATQQRQAWDGEIVQEARKANAHRLRTVARGGRSGRLMDRDLVQAVMAGDEHGAAQLLTAGADPDAKVTGDGSALIIASRSGRMDIARRLLARGANVDGFVLYDETPLINAARAGRLEMVRYLVEQGADPNLAVPSGNFLGEIRSPLGMARTPEIADYLRSRGARG